MDSAITQGQKDRIRAIYNNNTVDDLIAYAQSQEPKLPVSEKFLKHAWEYSKQYNDVEYLALSVRNAFRHAYVKQYGSSIVAQGSDYDMWRDLKEACPIDRTDYGEYL